MSRSRGSTLGWILAVAVFLAGQAYLFLWFAVWASASMPYQDAPRKLLQEQQLEMEAGWQGVKSAAIVAAVSCIWLVVKVARAWAARRARKAPPRSL